VSPSRNDHDWLAAAAALAARGRPLSSPNPSVGAVIVRDGVVVGRGWTRASGRPHAEAVALAQAGDTARGATLYVTLEPCAHLSERGPSCAHSIAHAGIDRVVIGVRDPDPRTAGQGFDILLFAGCRPEFHEHAECIAALAGYLARSREQRPYTTLKLATSLDGRIALPDGTSRWITGPEARAHGHLERARSDAILVGGETLRTDSPRLDVRLGGLEPRSPRRFVLTRGDAPAGWTAVGDVGRAGAFGDAQYLLIEGGAGAAAAFLAADRVDRLLLYRAPIVIGEGRPCVGDIGLASLDAAHGRWSLTDRRRLGSDTLDVYERIRTED
jgi:diaminohydroxyphosphoribosylaminopyrimidine deaminase/5-amino-6-(5-phosphoribosylamino)uracil reductase